MSSQSSTSAGGMVAGAVALVTGAGSGIGRATAVLLAREGAASVVLADRAAEALEQTAREVEALGATALVEPMDVSKPSEVDAVVDAGVERFGPLTCAVNCAGVNGPVKPIGDTTDAEWRSIHEVNLDGVFYCMRAEVRAMAGAGSIVNVSSGATIDPVPNMSPYVSSKTAVVGLTRSAAGEYVRAGIRVNAVLPGATLTPMLEAHAASEQGKKQVQQLPMQRFGEAAEVAEAIVWLCSARSSYVTGIALPVDGGSHSFWFSG